jgi:hypothetical protein
MPYQHVQEPLITIVSNQVRPIAIWGRCSGTRSASGAWSTARNDLLQKPGTLKQGQVTALLPIGKLQANPRRNALTRALQGYGRVGIV